MVWLATSAGIGVAAEFALDASHTSVHFAVSHYDISLVRGRFLKMSGTVQFDPEAKTGAVAISVEANSVDTGNKQLDHVLVSAQFLDAGQYPEVRFVGDRLLFEGSRLTAIDGTLTLHGVERPLRLHTQRFVCKEVPAGLARRQVCGGEFRTVINRLEFGMTRFVPEVGSEVELAISVEATRE